MKKYLALKASAGSGKTFALTVRYISLLLLDAKPNEILTLTFTNKAANEMSERIFKTLVNLGNDEAYLNAICEQSNLSKEEILHKKPYLIRLFSNANLSIFTIDKFVNKILREFCGYVGISDDFEIKEDDVESLSIKFLLSLNETQFDELINFSFYENRKFNSIFELFKNLIEKNEQIQTINIESSLIDLQKDEVLKKALKIKESILNCNVASDAVKKAVTFETFDELISKSWLEKSSLSEHNYFKKCANETLDSYFLDLKEQIGIYYKLRTTYSLSKLFGLYLMFKDFKLEFNKNKNYLEFNDISNLVYELLNNKIDKDFLYFRLDSKYSHILMDEFQDTSLLQYKILAPLIKEILSDGVDFKTFFYVGDTKQSIYRFRGGKRELFDYVSSNSDNLVEVEILNTNYRSTKNIISFVNSLFLNLPNYEYFNQESIKEGGFVEVLEDNSLEDDEKFLTIGSKIEELLNKGINPNNITILTYTNDDVLSLFYYLRQKFPNLKISTEMTSKLINQENVKALINAVKYLYFKESIYKENLNALMGKTINTPFELDIQLKNRGVQEIIKDIAWYLSIIDENIIKLIELCGVYTNIVDFIYEIDKLSAVMENSEQIGLQIMTIFKSKGLEFDTVILLDRLKKKNVDRSSLLFDYEGVDLQNIYYKISGYENYNEEYKNALEKEKKLSLEDEINILYVALTRAKNNMFIFKKTKSSVFDILNMKPLVIGNLIIENQQNKKEKILGICDYEPMDLGTQDKQMVVSKELDINHLHSKYFGLATHYCLEMIDNFNLDSLPKAINLIKSKFSNYLEEKDFEDIKNRVQKLLENSFFMELLKDADFSREQSLLFKEELKILDLLVFKNENFYIFDYKTTTEKLTEHKYQVKYYKKAIQNIFSTKNVFAYVVYLKPNIIEIEEI